VGICFSSALIAGDRVLIIHIGICMLAETIFMAGRLRSAGMKYVFTSVIEGAEIGGIMGEADVVMIVKKSPFWNRSRTEG
jgi:hypothetical protein